MFGHRPVSLGRHAGAVFGAAFVSSLVQVLVAISFSLVSMSMAGNSLAPPPAAAVAVAAFMLWIGLFSIVLGEIALFFTGGRFLLHLAKNNFGAAYLALGLVVGMIETSVLGSLRDGTSPREFIFAAATGLLGGFVYWVIAARDREAVASADRSETSAVFG